MGPTIDQIRALRPGVIVAVEVWPIWHVGIVSDERGPDGLPRVLSRSRRTGIAADEPWQTFAQTRRALPVAIVGYPSRRSPAEVLEAARRALGTPWNPLRNCEHFAWSAHGMPHSPTVEKIAAMVPGLLRVGLALA